MSRTRVLHALIALSLLLVAVGPVAAADQPQGTTGSTSAAQAVSAAGSHQGPSAVSILVLNTTSIGNSVQRALDELGMSYTIQNGDDWTGINPAGYDIVMATMDGGLVDEVDVQTVRTRVLDAGKKLVFLGGTCWQPFALGVNSYLMSNDTGNYCWTISSAPQWTLINSGHPLAQGLPGSYDWATNSAGYYQIRVNDGSADYVARNGDGYNIWMCKQFASANFTWFTDSVYDGYWGDPTDYGYLKQMISNAIQYGCGGNTLHVSNILPVKRDQGGGQYLVGAYVTIQDQDGAAVPAADVAVDITIPTGRVFSFTRSTNNSGTMVIGGRTRLTGTYTFCVTNVTKSGYTYDPNQNVETCDSITLP